MPVAIRMPYALTTLMRWIENLKRQEEEEEEELDGYLFDRERQHIEMEIRDKEALLDEFKRMHPRDWINIRRMEKEIDGLRKYLKGWR